MQQPPTPYHTARRRSIKRYPSPWLTARVAVITAQIALGEVQRHGSRHDFGMLCFQRALCARELRNRGDLPAHMEAFGRPENIRQTP